MTKKATAIFLLIAAVYWSFSALLPHKISGIDTDKNSFSTARALVHLETISKNQHYVGSKAHPKVRDYIVEQLKNLDFEIQIQEGYSITDFGNLSKPANIIARRPGSNNGKALLLLSHYDSEPHSSFGASDAGSGVVTILEGLRAFLNDGKTSKNDIVVLISDSEELGLNGADIFVNRHPWAKDIGLVLNFEARGSGGPSYMLMETNGGNANLMKGFAAANPQFPVANSLAYSIYKMLPNDTDLTIFREDGDIDGFNFAFIDDHFDYHTALDSYERLDRNTLEHQGSYVMPMLNYFAYADLNSLKSDADYIYFNMPLLKTVIYPFSWIFPMLVLAYLLFGALLVYGIKKGRFVIADVFKGFIPFLGALVTGSLTVFGLWKLILFIYPQYNEILHGFTYNGHNYIAAFVSLTIGICFWMYHKFYKPGNTASLLIAPLFLWLLICTVVAFKLNGASFFIIPVYFALLSLFVLVKWEKPSLILLALICFPVLLIMSPFVQMFPVGLGLKILFVSAVFTVLIFGFTLPVIGFLERKKRWSGLMFFISLCAFVLAHFNSGFNKERPKPNSLVYILNTDDNTAQWATYDNILDNWTRNYFDEDEDDTRNLKDFTFASKYNSGFSFVKNAPVKDLISPITEIRKDTIIDDSRYLRIYIEPRRNVNRIDVFSDPTNVFKAFKMNGVEVYNEIEDSYAFEKRISNKLISYYISDNSPLVLEFSTPKDQQTVFQLFESSFDLLTHPTFTIPERGEDMIPKPFVLNDAVIIAKTIFIE